ncbi:MAG: alpha-amylase/4-alpha-glucanotransferase domain-containing protein [Burkholderiales bacterium]
MSQTISLLFGVHAHQPVGNFNEVLEDAHHRCYRPFIHTLHRFPEFRFAAHFSGWLLDWLLQRYPEDMALLREMVERGQAELFGAGDTEPVLAVIPYRDRVGQIDTLSDKLEETLGSRPSGAWLTERVWEATVVPSLADAHIRYVTVDDYHFLCAGKPMEELNGYFTTEEDGRKLDLFPISEQLRYRIPFSPAQETVGYIESLAREGVQAAAVYFDDIEKFGIWPETYDWVYVRGWLTDFIQGVLASKTIRTERYSDYHAAVKTRGVVYLPTTSYIEMNEWTLPAQQANSYADLVHEHKAAGRFEQNKAFLRGGMWKNFLSRYPESNWMHKRMLSLSERYHALPEEKQQPEMRKALYEAQANDAYWHGLFGGLYLPHLRRAVYRAVVRLEAMLDKLAPRPENERHDLDLDGSDEQFLHNGLLQAIIPLDGRAAVRELDTYVLNHNFGDTLRRQDEHYYRKIHLQESTQHAGEGIASPHDRVAFKHEIHPQDMAVDAYARASFCDSLSSDGGAPMALVHYEGVFQNKGLHCHIDTLGGRIEKHIALDGNRLIAAYRFEGHPHGFFSTEINLAMPSCDGPAGRYVADGAVVCGFGEELIREELAEIALEDDVMGGRVVLRCDRPAHFRAVPHFTVSQSEAGFEKIMQAVTITLQWPMDTPLKKLGVSLEVLKTGEPMA